MAGRSILVRTGRAGFAVVVVAGLVGLAAVDGAGARSAVVPVRAPKPPPVDKATPILEGDGPLEGVVMTADAAGDAPPAAWQLAFTPADRAVTALVGLGPGAPKRARLTVAWYRVTPSGRRVLLFSQRVKARSAGGVAFSEGVTENGLAPGAYEVVATLGRRQVRVPWVVRVPAASSAPSAAAAAPAGDEDWNVPDAGDHGWYEPEVPAAREAEPEAEPPDPCAPSSMYGKLMPLTSVNAQVVFGSATCSATLTASVSGPAHTLASGAGSPNEAETLWFLSGNADLCTDIPGGSDLPGTAVQITATVAQGATLTETLVLEDTGFIGPVVAMESDPPAGTRVESGDRIKVHALAMMLPPTFGIDTLSLAADGTPVAQTGNVSGSREPVPCDLGRYYANLTYTYEVPDDPPPILTLAADAVDFLGRRGEASTATVSFPTVAGDLYTGTMHLTQTGAQCEGEENGPVLLVVRHGKVTGNASVAGSYTCDPGITVATSGTIGFGGTMRDDTLRLEIDDVGGTLALTPVCLVGQMPRLRVEGGSGSVTLETTPPSGDVYACSIDVQRVGAPASG